MLRRIIAHYDARSRLFAQMMRRFRLDRGGDVTMSEAVLLRRAMERCIACSAAGRCAAWMARGEDCQGADAFCPNAGLFRELRAAPRPRDIE